MLRWRAPLTIGRPGSTCRSRARTSRSSSCCPRACTRCPADLQRIRALQGRAFGPNGRSATCDIMDSPGCQLAAPCSEPRPSRVVERGWAVVQYKFIVDGEWKYAPDQPAMHDERDIINNVVEVQEYVPDHLDSLIGFEPPPSPPKRCARSPSSPAPACRRCWAVLTRQHMLGSGCIVQVCPLSGDDVRGAQLQQSPAGGRGLCEGPAGDAAAPAADAAERATGHGRNGLPAAAPACHPQSPVLPAQRPQHQRHGAPGRSAPHLLLRARPSAQCFCLGSQQPRDSQGTGAAS